MSDELGVKTTKNISILKNGIAFKCEDKAIEQLVPISSISIPKGRIRKEFADIPALAESIKYAGLIQCPLVKPLGNDKYELVTGERRLRALMLLGVDLIPVRVRAYDDLEAKIAENEENIQRKDISWVDQAAAYDQLDQLYRARFGSGGRGTDGGWTDQKSASVVGEKGPGNFTIKKKAGQLLRERPELKDLVKNLPMAAGIKKLDQILNTEKLHKDVAAGKLTFSSDFKNVDALVGIREVESESISLVLTDPPFGMGELQASVGEMFGPSATYTSFLKPTDNQTVEQVRVLLTTLAPELFRVLKPGSCIFMFCSFEIYHAFLLDLLRDTGFEIGHQPLIWDKGRPTTQFSGYDFPSCYEPIVFGHKPPRRRLTNPKLQNILRYSPVHSGRKLHPFEKPVELLQDLIETATAPGEKVFDPFAGSGSVARACRGLSRSSLSFELDKDNFVRAQAGLA